MTTTVSPSIVVCPTCDALIGQPCKNLTPEGGALQGWHPRRVDDASLSVPELSVDCPDCYAAAGMECSLPTGERVDFCHASRRFRYALWCPASKAAAEEAEPAQSVTPSKVIVCDGKGVPVSIELSVQKGVLVVDVDTNGDVDLDMYGETFMVIRAGRREM